MYWNNSSCCNSTAKKPFCFVHMWSRTHCHNQFPANYYWAFFFLPKTIMHCACSKLFTQTTMTQLWLIHMFYCVFFGSANYIILLPRSRDIKGIDTFFRQSTKGDKYLPERDAIHQQRPLNFHFAAKLSINYKSKSSLIVSQIDRLIVFSFLMAPQSVSLLLT